MRVLYESALSRLPWWVLDYGRDAGSNDLDQAERISLGWFMFTTATILFAFAAGLLVGLVLGLLAKG